MTNAPAEASSDAWEPNAVIRGVLEHVASDDPNDPIGTAMRSLQVRLAVLRVQAATLLHVDPAGWKTPPALDWDQFTADPPAYFDQAPGGLSRDRRDAWVALAPTYRDLWEATCEFSDTVALIAAEVIVDTFAESITTKDGA